MIKIINSYNIKEYIINNNKIEDILIELQMHHIKNHIDYYSCGMPNGDNPSSTIIYKSNLYVEAYTRNIVDKYGVSDIISLVCFIRNCYFTEGIKWICDILGLDTYNNDIDDIPESLKITKMLYSMNNDDGTSKEESLLSPISEKILSYYLNIPNKIFLSEGISITTQNEFEIGFDCETNRITMPIRDELSTLVGVKGRLNKEKLDEHDNKYLYLEKCAKSQILYGLYKTIHHVKIKKQVIVVESEKSVLKLWENGIYNVVAIGGHKLSDTQIEKLTRLGVNEIILCFDEEVYKYDIDTQIKFKPKETIELYKTNYSSRFIINQTISAMIDFEKILGTKESPADDIDKFQYLYEKRIYLQQYLV